MRSNWNFIKGLFLLGLVVFLYAFSSFKNNSRPVTSVNVQFTGEDNVFITSETVNKLLIQSQEKPYFLPKEGIFLKDRGEYSWETETRKPAAPARMRVLCQPRSAKAPMVPHTGAQRKTLSCSINCASSSGWLEGRLSIPITVSHTWASV